MCGVKYFDYCLPCLPKLLQSFNPSTNGNEIDKDDFDFFTFIRLINVFAKEIFKSSLTISYIQTLLQLWSKPCRIIAKALPKFLGYVFI